MKKIITFLFVVLSFLSINKAASAETNDIRSYFLCGIEKSSEKIPNLTDEGTFIAIISNGPDFVIEKSSFYIDDPTNFFRNKKFVNIRDIGEVFFHKVAFYTEEVPEAGFLILIVKDSDDQVKGGYTILVTDIDNQNRDHFGRCILVSLTMETYEGFKLSRGLKK